MFRAKQLESELTEARVQIQNLMAENRILKILERRQGDALSKYEGTHAQLPLVIKSYGADLKTLQTRIRRLKTACRELENKNRTQSIELATVKKQHKHLLDLTKNKQLGEREKLSNQLEEAENSIKQQEKKNQNLMKKIVLQEKNHRNQISVEVGKTKALQAELKRAKEANDRLQTKLEKLQYQSYGGRRSYVWSGASQCFGSGPEPSVAPHQSKISLLEGGGGGQGDRAETCRGDGGATTNRKSLRPELVHNESEISDHTKELQRNLMKQVHEDVIRKPNMLAHNSDNDESPSEISGDGNASWLDRGISELIKEKDFPDGNDQNNIVAANEIAKPIVNPFSLSDAAYGRTEKHESGASGSDTDRVNTKETLESKKPIGRPFCVDDDDDDEDVSSISSDSD